MKLRTKTHFYSSVLFAVMLLVANVTVYFIFYKLTIDRELDQFEAETQQASEVIRETDNRAATAELLRAYVPLNGMIRIVNERKLDNSSEPLVTAVSETALREQPAIFYPNRQAERITISGKSYGFVSIPFIRPDGNVANIQATKSLEELMALLGILRIVLISVSAAVMIPAIVSSGILGSLIMRPIEAMTKTMQEITRSGKFVKLKQDVRSQDELVEMGNTFNEMIGLLETSFTKQEQFVSNASHELKTPLTVIESYASLLKRRGQQRPELIMESVEAIHSEAVRMKVMTDQLLLLAKPHRNWVHAMTNIELLPLVEQMTTSFRSTYNRELTVISEGDKPHIAYSDEDMLKQLLVILLDNARKYSSGEITVKIGANQCHRFIEVIDRGMGIPEDELELVFNRFYRVDKARTKDAEHDGGAGLGLSLAKEISEVIGAKIVLQSREGEGTTAILFLPPVRSAHPALSQ
ncbi:sensor histidine kinase [Paenibacillus mendelii]|uniref:histidine kinase n=1 Tax=Paenibacillus mendelii TaxID=206163 RepID=A0ABV6JIA8_9BACL|nr:HAMP domain-containing sensor histidine kinase [Paenibacillus mendelii]MCQ6557147.1 HAMP domain-containing histidine kinase [Paenibacillus mendelii]